MFRHFLICWISSITSTHQNAHKLFMNPSKDMVTVDASDIAFMKWVLSRRHMRKCVKVFMKRIWIISTDVVGGARKNSLWAVHPQLSSFLFGITMDSGRKFISAPGQSHFIWNPNQCIGFRRNNELLCGLCHCCCTFNLKLHSLCASAPTIRATFSIKSIFENHKFTLLQNEYWFSSHFPLDWCGLSSNWRAQIQFSDDLQLEQKLFNIFQQRKHSIKFSENATKLLWLSINFNQLDDNLF